MGTQPGDPYGRSMIDGPGARTPEDLEVLLEDAWITRDVGLLVELFDDAAVLRAGGGAAPAHGRAEIAATAMAIWGRGETYVADPGVVVQAGAVALSLGRAINVAQRGTDGAWRFAIALLRPDHPWRREHT
jgi:hypothetical protein